MKCHTCKTKITFFDWLHLGHICPKCMELKLIEENTRDAQVRRFKKNQIRNRKQ